MTQELRRFLPRSELLDDALRDHKGVTSDTGPGGTELELLGRLTRGALHELANPLLALTGSAEFALADAEPGTKLRARLEVVHSTALEIGELVRALQGFIREGAAPVRSLELAEFGAETIAFVRRVSAVRDLELVAQADAEPVVLAAPGEMRRRLVELVLDGIAAAEPGSRVVLLVSQDGGDAVAGVEGIGELRLPAETG